MTRLVSLIVLAMIVLITGVLFYQVMINYFVPVFIALVLTIVFQPVHQWILRRCKQRERLAAGLTTAAILLIVLTPLALIIWKATVDALSVLRAVQVTAAEQGATKGADSAAAPLAPTGASGVTEPVGGAPPRAETAGPKEDPQTIVRFINKIVADINERTGFEIDPKAVLKGMVDQLQVFAGKAPGVIGGMVFGIIVLVFSLYYFLADGEEMIQAMLKMNPLKSGYQVELLSEFQTVSRAIVSATLLSALCQGLLGGIGYYIAGMPSVFLLMLLTMLLSMVPLVGSMSVWGGSALYLYFTGHVPAAIGLALYGALVISMSDNIVKPMVLQGQSKLHPLWALLSVLGGMAALGPIGIFVGPIVVAFLQAGLKMFQQELTSLEQRGKVIA